MADNVSDDEEKLQYIKQEFFQPISGHSTTVDDGGGMSSLNHSNSSSSRPWYQRHADAEYSDNESNFFMSEPSMSDHEADLSDNPMRLLESPFEGKDGEYMEDSLLFVDKDGEDDDDEHIPHHLGLPPPPPPPPPMAARGRVHNPYAAPHSPGNTSLSSWDTSPHLTKRVHVHFSPPRHSDTESRSNGNPPTNIRTMNGPPRSRSNTNETPPTETRAPDRTMRGTKNEVQNATQQQQQQELQEQHCSSNSTSPASEGRMQQLEAFLDDLRLNSEGKVQDSSQPDSNASFESSMLQGFSTVQDVLRQPILPQSVEEQKRQSTQPSHHHSRVSSMDTAIVQNTSNPNSLHLPVSMPTMSRDEQTLNMVLSDSGDEQDHHKNGNNKANKASQQETSVPVSKSADSQDFPQDDVSPTIVRTKSMDETTPKSKQKSPERKGFFERAGFLRRKARKNKNAASNNDDTRTNEDDPQPAIPAKKPAHRRQRSGDATAAKLSTGSDQWKGMTLDMIPMPDAGDETDTTTDTKKKSSNANRNGSGRSLFGKVKGTIDRKEEYGQRRIKQNGLGNDSSGISLPNRSNSPRQDEKEHSMPPTSSRASEIAQFSQFALGTTANDDVPTSPRPRPRRIKQRSYRTMRRAHLNGNSERSTSPSSTEQNNFFLPSPSTQSSQSSYQQSPGIYSSPILSGYMASPSVRKTFNPNEVQAWQTRSSPPSFAGPPPPIAAPPVALSSSWTSSGPMEQPLPPYVPTYDHQRSYSEIPQPGVPGTYPPPPLFGSTSWHAYSQSPDALSAHAFDPSDYQRPQGGTPIRGVPGPIPPPPSHQPSMRMPDKSSPMFKSESHLLHRHHPSDVPRKVHSFDNGHYDESQEGESSFFIEDPADPHINFNTPPVEDSSYVSSDGDESLEFERNINRLHAAHYEERVLRQHLNSTFSPFSMNQQKVSSSTDRRRFLPQTNMDADDPDGSKYPTYICPVCNTRQREFFTVSSAPKQFEGPSGFIAFYFAIYVIGSLYIFGLQEGWTKLDCIYFAVITLTTAGLGDFVPTSDGAKIICSIFIYFGVACIGLLLGSYIAGMLDERSRREAVANQIKACPNCARIQNIKDAAERRREAFPHHLSNMHAMTTHADAGNVSDQRAAKKMRHSPAAPMFHSERPSPSQGAGFSTPTMSGRKKPDLESFESPSVQKPVMESPTLQRNLLGSPMTTQILGRQNHTRHFSMDFGGSVAPANPGNNFQPAPKATSRRPRNFSMDIPATVEEGVQAKMGVPSEMKNEGAGEDVPSASNSLEKQESTFGTTSDEYSMDTTDSLSTSSGDDVLEAEYNNLKNAKYIFLTLREALINSMVIIAFGCLGFCLIENFSVIDSWYFTTVLLTTVGYGDITPTTEGGKLFATAYLLVAGTILLNNMSMISMIPLELRKRRTEQAVLTQFGDSLDDEALRELATGPVIQRINLASQDSRGLDVCTREMFALAMLIRLGKVTEQDINLTFAAFRRLDVSNEGVLNSKSIISGLIQKHASNLNLAALANPNAPKRRPSKVRDPSSRTATTNASWSTLGSWMVAPTTGTAAPRTTSTSTSISSTSTPVNSETVPLMHGVGQQMMYGNPPFVSARE